MAELLGTFEQVVLLAVLHAGEEAYGRAVLRGVEVGLERERSVAAGAVYATLDRLEGKGLLVSWQEEGTPARGGRARRFYKVTAGGFAALNEARRALDRMWKDKTFPLEVTA